MSDPLPSGRSREEIAAAFRDIQARNPEANAKLHRAAVRSGRLAGATQVLILAPVVVFLVALIAVVLAFALL